MAYANYYVYRAARLFLQQGLASEWERIKDGGQTSDETALVYPIAKVSGYKLPLQRLFFGVKRKDYNTNNTRYTEPGARLTNMEEAKVGERAHQEKKY